MPYIGVSLTLPLAAFSAAACAFASIVVTI